MTEELNKAKKREEVASFTVDLRTGDAERQFEEARADLPLHAAAASAVVAVAAAPRDAFAQTIKDAARRTVAVPAKVSRVFPAGPPAAILLYTLAPDLLLGWARANRPEECAYMLPDICTRPEVGRITGRGNTANPCIDAAARKVPRNRLHGRQNRANGSTSDASEGPPA